MRILTPRRLWSLVWGLPLACGAVKGGLDDGQSQGDLLVDDDALGGQVKAASAALHFPGAGTSGAARPITGGLGPETAGDCNPAAAATDPGTSPDVQTVCFFDESDPTALAATIEQVVEVVGNDRWVHIRLTLSPGFVDNTYGANAVGWGDLEDGPAPREDRTPADAPSPRGRPPRNDDGEASPPAADAPAARPDAGARPGPEDAPPRPGAPQADAGAPPPPAGEPGDAPFAPRNGPGGGRTGHTFRDLTGSDHAEIQLLDANGEPVLRFRIDYVSESEAATSGHASLGVSGGEGRVQLGDPAWILAATTSIDRNLNACALADFTDDSPATDEAYTPNPAATDWDYRVYYEVWVSTDAFGSTGFGSALIDNVHASPSKAPGDTIGVVPAPCPGDSASPEPLPPVLAEIR